MPRPLNSAKHAFQQLERDTIDALTDAGRIRNLAWKNAETESLFLVISVDGVPMSGCLLEFDSDVKTELLRGVALQAVIDILEANGFVKLTCC